MSTSPVNPSRGVNNTAFTPNADKTAQMTGSGQPVPGSVIAALAATIALDAYAIYSNYVNLTNTAGQSAVTVTIGLIPPAGGFFTVCFNQYSGGSGALTFSTGFKAAGTLTPGSAKSRSVLFQSDGTNYVEVTRSTADVG